MWKKHGIFQQFLFSYICVLIPMLALSLWQIGELRSSYAKKQQEQIYTRMSYAMERLDEQASGYWELSAMLANEQVMMRYRVISSVQNAKAAIERLQVVGHSNTEVHDVFMAYGDSRIYAGGGMSRMNVYLRDVLRLNEEDAERVLRCIESENKEVIRAPSIGNDAWILYHYPARIYRNGATVSVNVLLNENVLMRAVEQILGDEQFCFSLNPVGSAATVWSCSEGRAIDAIPDSCALIHRRGDFFELTVGFDENAMLAEGASRWLLWYAILAMTMLGLLVLSVLMSRRHYRPVARLVRQTGSASHTGAPGQSENEYEYISNQLRHIVEESSRLSGQLAREKEEVRRQSATLIFNGVLPSRSEVQSRMSFIGVSLETDCFAVLAYEAADSETLRVLQQRAEDCLTYCIPNGETTTLYVLVGLHDDDPDGGERLNLAMAGAGDLQPRMGVSGAWEDLNQIPQARLEADWALAQTDRGGRPVLYQNVRQNELSQWVEDLEKALSDRNREQATELMRSMQNSCGADQSLAQENVRKVVVSVIASLQLDDPEAYERLVAMMGADASASDNWAVLEQLVARICDSDDHGEVVAAALEYIRSHFTENTLSLENVADHCGVSAAHLSRLFKKKMGVGYIDYVTELRMNEARNLLIGTALPVAEVAQRVGYLNVSSFRKKFKLVTGLSLSEYRKENRRDE